MSYPSRARSALFTFIRDTYDDLPRHWRDYAEKIEEIIAPHEERLSKRELFAAISMNGLRSRGQYEHPQKTSEEIACQAVLDADALMSELAKDDD